MKEIAMMNLQLFAEEGAPAAPTAAPEAAADTGTAAEIGTDVTAGDQLADGTQVPNAQVAAALNRQMKRHPELRKVYSQRQPQAPAAQQAAPVQQPAEAGQKPAGEPSLEDRWNELRNGEFKELYGRDVQSAIRDRFKNQDDSTAKLTAMQPMLNALMKKAGVESVEELQNIVLDDDSLYEEDAEAMGMPVEAYKRFKQLQDEHDRLQKQQEQSMEQQRIRDHIAGLVRQGEEFRQTFPGFDINVEMQNPNFRKLTSPEIGLSVADAYFAIHHNELTPQLMGYGMQRARQQMSQTIQAQAARPAEGAMRPGAQRSADVKINPKTMTRAERAEIKRRVRMGEAITFD